MIVGCDWTQLGIVPYAMRALAAAEPIAVRSPRAIRPWQHVLEPFGGYLCLVEALATAQTLATAKGPHNPHTSAFNLGPSLEANRSVAELVDEALLHWSGSWRDCSDPQAPHEADRLKLQIDKAHHQRGWQPRWPFATTVTRTVAWYHAVHESASPLACCLADLEAYKAHKSHDN